VGLKSKGDFYREDAKFANKELRIFNPVFSGFLGVLGGEIGFCWNPRA
jgi:hypothetical protein